jgi:pilus assembly protein Flp/PilA
MQHAKSTSVLCLAAINIMFPFNFVMTGPLAEETGATAIEYGLLAALIAIAIVAAISATGTSLVAVYNYWSSAISAAI